MRISRLCYLMAAAALVAAVIAPVTASAELLTNEWGQQFNGGRSNALVQGTGCLDCHAPKYGATTHGEFARTGADLTPALDSGMWPVGLSGKGDTFDGTDTFALGAGTGLQEYIVFGAVDTPGVPFGVLTAGWDPASPSLWEIDGTTGVEAEAYGCNQCHHVGAVKLGVKPRAVGNFAPGGLFNDVTGTANTWATSATADPAVFASYIPGSGIQCERCHGTGVAARADQGGHFNAGVKIVGFGSDTAASTRILDSQVCGQCHGSFKSAAGFNVAGYTPDATLTDFVGLNNQYTASDIPTSGSFTSTSKFFPNGENRTNKHIYYTEWAMSGHSIRGAYTKNSTGSVTPYQASGASHYVAARSSAVLCNRCHTGEGYLKRKGAKIMSNFTEASVGTTPTNEGFIGQECATCHISHGATTAPGEAVGMAVRAPEAANGQYSTNGLSVANKSVCEDCHNWQAEVLANGAAVPAPVLPATLGKYVSHPQREVYHGRAMLEIPAGTDFMPGAKCEQCHMPATYSDLGAASGLPRYTDRNAKRYSHRMFIMEPGDAKAWGLAPFGDSCSPCHAGETQDQLQANIDNWQSTASALSVTLTTAITNGRNLFAVAPAVTAVDSQVPAAELDLLKRASANLSLYTQDSSGGAHNPKYEQAGLTKAIDLAKSAGGEFTEFVAPKTVVGNALFAIAGTLENGDHTAPVGATVAIFDGATQVGSTTSDANGNFGFQQAQSATKTYTIKWERSSQSLSDLTETAIVTVTGTVTPPSDATATTVSIHRSASAVARNVRVTFTGALSPAMAAPVMVQYKKPGSSAWVTFRTITTAAATGTYSTTFGTGTRGLWYFRTIYAGSSAFRASTSAISNVRIR